MLPIISYSVKENFQFIKQRMSLKQMTTSQKAKYNLRNKANENKKYKNNNKDDDNIIILDEPESDSDSDSDYVEENSTEEDSFSETTEDDEEDDYETESSSEEENEPKKESKMSSKKKVEEDKNIKIVNKHSSSKENPTKKEKKNSLPPDNSSTKEKTNKKEKDGSHCSKNERKSKYEKMDTPSLLKKYKELTKQLSSMKEAELSKTKKEKKKHKHQIDDSDNESEDDNAEPNDDNKTDDEENENNKKNKEEEDDEEEEEDENQEEQEQETNTKKNKKKEDDKNVNIIFTIKKSNAEELGEEEDYDDYCMEDEFEEYVEDETEEFDSDDEKVFMKENYITLPKLEEPILKNNSNKKSSKKEKEKTSKKDKKKKEEELKNKETAIINIESEYLDLLDTKKHLVEKLFKHPTSKILQNALTECNQTINELMKKARSNNTKQYFKLVIGKEKKQSELEYFRNKLSNKEQIGIMTDLKEVNKSIQIEKPYRLSILQSNIPANFKAIAIQKLNMLRSMDPGDTEYFKIKNWVDTFMRIPFSTYKGLSVNIDDGIDVCNSFLENAKKKLDDCVYGLEDAKLQIMQMVGQWITNPAAMGTAIAIKGPMGTGKSSLVKDGISKILGREFAFIALGGAGDSSFLEGHSYTYEGSTWGKIVQIIIDSKCMNPVIYFDELDKISDSPRGQEIIGILTHLTDTTQNSQFHDKYFSELDFDLSKCLFIFSYNDDNLVNSILKDRMYCIQTKGYDVKEKTIIARNYLLPKIREQVNIPEDNIIITDDVLQYIITNQSFTKNESGVRNLKRCLEIIYTKLNLFRLVKPENNMFSKQMDIEVSFPMTITRKHVDILIKNEENQNQSLLAMYV